MLTSRQFSSIFRTLLCICLLVVPGYLFAQRTAGVQPDEVKWQLDATENGVQFFHAITSCNNQKKLLVKISNTNRYSVNIAYTVGFGDIPEKITNDLLAKKLVLSSGSSVAGNCVDLKMTDVVFDLDEISPHHRVDVSTFSFNNISVKRSTGK